MAHPDDEARALHLSITEIADGGVIEQLNEAMLEVARNILDPNTVATEKREVTLKLTVTPDKTRESFSLTSRVTPKLAAPEPISQRLFVGQRMGAAFVWHHGGKQADMFTTTPAEPANVGARGLDEEGEADAG